MSAHEFRTALVKRIELELHGDGVERSGVIATMKAGMCPDYAFYRDLCGYIRALEAVKEWSIEVYAEMHETPPDRDPFNQS